MLRSLCSGTVSCKSAGTDLIVVVAGTKRLRLCEVEVSCADAVTIEAYRTTDEVGAGLSALASVPVTGDRKPASFTAKVGAGAVAAETASPKETLNLQYRAANTPFLWDTDNRSPEILPGETLVLNVKPATDDKNTTARLLIEDPDPA